MCVDFYTSECRERWVRRERTALTKPRRAVSDRNACVSCRERSDKKEDRTKYSLQNTQYFYNVFHKNPRHARGFLYLRASRGRTSEARTNSARANDAPKTYWNPCDFNGKRQRPSGSPKMLAFLGVSYIGLPSLARLILLVVVLTKGVSRMMTLVTCL